MGWVRDLLRALWVAVYLVRGGPLPISLGTVCAPW
jgi:hypothetical protein